MEWLAGLVGVVIGALARGWVEDRRRWHADRRTVYANYLRACGNAHRLALRSDRVGRLGMSLEGRAQYISAFASELDAAGTALGEVRLMGSPAVVLTADALEDATRSLDILNAVEEDPDRAKAYLDRLDGAWNTARSEFEVAAREELGIKRTWWRVW